MRLWHHEAACILITGKKGSGKSTLWLQKLKAWPGRKFVFDHKLEVTHKLGWKAQTNPDQMKAAVAAGLPVVFYPGVMFPANRPAGFDFFCRWVFEVAAVLPGKKVLAIDEVQQWTDVGPSGVPESFQLILDDGRLRGLDLLMISQAPNEVNKGIRRQITEIYCFKHTDGLVLEWLERDPFCLDRTEIPKLKSPGGWIWRNVDTDQMKRSSGNAPDTKGKANRRESIDREKA